MSEDRTVYICSQCNKEYSIGELNKNSHYSPCGHIVVSRMAVYVYSPSTVRNTNCPICNNAGLDLGESGIRTCPSVDCSVIKFKTTRKRPPYPAEKQLSELKEKVEEFREYFALRKNTIDECIGYAYQERRYELGGLRIKFNQIFGEDAK